MKNRIQLAVLCVLLTAVPAAAQDTAPKMGRYLPLYPALYFSAAHERDERDRSFDQAGVERDSAAPSLATPSSFPQTRLDAVFSWYFPMFETLDLPFFSSRLHTARIHLSRVSTRSEGALATFAADASDDARTDADDLQNNGSGNGDITMEFGSFLYGSENWRTREHTPLAVLAMVGLRLPVGQYDRDAPINAGTNTAAAHVQLGLHAQPWPGGFVDAGVGLRAYFKNQDPAFGALMPTQQGDDVYWDLSLAQRLYSGLYVTAQASGREGDDNLYVNPRFAAGAPPPTTVPQSDNFPTPGQYRDRGTALRSAGLSLSYFISQRWLLGAHYTQALSGRSGEFELPYTNRRPAGCTVGATGCITSAGGSAQVDGLGPARSYASNRLMFTLDYNFGQEDAYPCAGCTSE